MNFEINNHLINQPNRQVQLSYIFSCYNVLHMLPTPFHGVLRSWESPVNIEWGESAIAFELPCVQSLLRLKCQSKWLVRWPIVVTNAVYNNGHSEPVLLVPIVFFAFSLSPVYSLVHMKATKLGSFQCQSYLLVNAALLYSVLCINSCQAKWSISLFYVAVKLLLTHAKPL